MGFFKKLIDQVKKEYPEIGAFYDMARGETTSNLFGEYSEEENEDSEASNDETYGVSDFLSDFFQDDKDGEFAIANSEIDEFSGYEFSEESKDGDNDFNMNSVLSNFLGDLQEDTDNRLEMNIECEDKCHTQLDDKKQELLENVYRDPADIEMAEETRKRINALIRHNLKERKFLWGRRDVLEQAGDYIVEYCAEDFEDLCEYLGKIGVRYDKPAFQKELKSFISSSMVYLMERSKVDEYIFLDRMDGEEIIQRLETEVNNITRNRETQKGFYLRLNHDLIDRDGRVVETDLFVTIYPDEPYVDWESPEVKEYILFQFKEKYGYNLYYEQVDRSNFDISKLD